MTRAFLTAEWRYLAMLNYEVDPAMLMDRVPAGTELDFHEGRTFVSAVGFRFLSTRVLGLRIPLHEDFDEINLRFYVRRKSEGGWRRGVVFVREIVPKPAIALVARVGFRENYIAVPMSHAVDDTGSGDARRVCAVYGWNSRDGAASLRLRARGDPSPLADGSLQQFIAEHYWGYGIGSGRRTLEYEVRHDPWRVWDADEASFAGNPERMYGRVLSPVLRDAPHSAFLAEGSPVEVYPARTLRA